MTVPAIIEHFPYLGLFLLLILGGVGLPFPEDTTLILCGFLIASGVIRPLPALAAVYSGLLIADCSLHFAGKKYGRLIFAHGRFGRILSPERLSEIGKAFKRRGVLIILAGRHIVGLRAQIFIASGVLRMNTLKFIVADAVSSLLTIALMVGVGYAGGNSLDIIRKDLRRGEHVAVVVVVIAVTIFLLRRYFKSRRSS